MIRLDLPSSILYSHCTVFHGKPIIGIAGGIGSGKSFVARLFGELGCCVIHADDQVRAAYDDPEIRDTLRQWWGPQVFKPDRSINRPAVAQLIFSDPEQRIRLEQLLHPWVARQRDIEMERAIADTNLKAIVWDTPLLFEAGLDRDCDVVVFVDAPQELRWNRVIQSRGWTESELIRREKLQWGLDKKRNASHYMVVNTADTTACRSQVREILSRILAN
jgi:dephospho-CoA kinase